MLRDGDLVRIDTRKRTIDAPALDDPEVMAARRKEWDALIEDREPPQRGVLARYARTVSSAHLGATVGVAEGSEWKPVR